MKTFYLAISLFLISLSITVTAQDSCKVLAKNLQGIYSGECRKGLAHGTGYAKGVDNYIGLFKKGYPNGKGRYMWSNGDIYEGIWKKGARTGLGKFSHFENGKEIVQDGIWLNDEYKGPKKILPQILRQTNISSADIVRISDGKTIYIKVKQNSMAQSVNYEYINGSSGSKFFSGSIAGYDDIDFPFTCVLKYTYWNTFRTAILNASVEFKITEPGTYEVRITNL